jgi:hypothetical protein
MIALIVVLAAGGTYGVSSQQHAQYTTSTQIKLKFADAMSPVTAIESPKTFLGIFPRDLNHVMAYLTTHAIARSAYRILGVPIGTAGSVSVGLLYPKTYDDYFSNVIVLSATGTSATLTARLANAYVSAFLTSRREAVAAAAAAAVRAQQAALSRLAAGPSNAGKRQALTSLIEALRALQLNPSPEARQLALAEVPPAPSSASPAHVAAFAAALALLCALGIALGLDALERRVKGSPDPRGSLLNRRRRPARP